MFPIGDQNEPGRGLAYATLGLIGINIIVFVVLQAFGDPQSAFTYGYSAIPFEITTGEDLVRAVRGIPQTPGPSPIYLTLLSSMFMHGGIGHIAGNMLFLFIFGDNLEHRFGTVVFVAFYLAAGIVAAFAQILIQPDSVVPTLGASGAISGVLGAYLVLFPRNRVTVFLFRFLLPVPAIVAIGMWAVFQFLSGAAQLGADAGESGGVAYMAHIGGFIAGVVFGLLMRTSGRALPPAYRTA